MVIFRYINFFQMIVFFYKINAVLLGQNIINNKKKPHTNPNLLNNSVCIYHAKMHITIFLQISRFKVLYYYFSITLHTIVESFVWVRSTHAMSLRGNLCAL